MKMHFTARHETLDDVAATYQVPLHVLKSVNQHIYDPSNVSAGTQVNIPAIMGMGKQSVPDAQKGNVCAYVSGEPAHYIQPNITHWPSQDYTVLHPNYGAHTPVMCKSEKRFS
ncbi:hypothetical protein [Shouchella shacheensis]|uniref:hypothetical protein n=1 Tax=Shouchella shacheensis TaxID=1649580 RepID=UPI00073FBC43|nr:hypothetical protein [Shouchella shacheensis]